ncbi:MAG TPA: DUF2569 family protein [Allosphingosinicella sp.]|jgi:hypothetical protein|nr:DUF2569 family protein [Allosphingosinicella sp.]
MAYEGEVRGVGGWLVFFILVMAVISPLISSVQVYSELYGAAFAGFDDDPLLSTSRIFAWALVAMTAIIGWFVAYRLISVHNWTSVKLAIAGIWIVGVGGMVAEYAGVMYIGGIPLDALLAETGPRGVIQPFIFGLIWTSYLLKSERVANTYRGAADQAEIFE